MNQHLQSILNFIEQDKTLSEVEKNALLKSLKDADKEFEITNFKLDRTEKVKRTTAILLEETIEELEQKRKAVEAQNRELEIESSLERVRTVAMSMNKPDDMLEVCKSIALQLQSLGVKDIRNVQTAIFYEEKGSFTNYEFYVLHDKKLVTQTNYTDHKITRDFAEKMLRGKDEVATTSMVGKEVKDWLIYQKSTNVFIDSFLENANSLSYYWHSLGPVALGISTYTPLTEEELFLFQRFLKVFDLSYRRYLDIEKAAAQAKEAQLEASLERVRAQALGMRTASDLTTICEVLYTELYTLGFPEMRNAMINIHDDEKGTFINYDYSDEIGKSTNHLRYDIHPVIEKQIRQMRSAGDAFSETFFKGKDLEDWKNFRKKIGEKDDPRIETTDALYYYFYSIGTGSIGISTFIAITEEKLSVLKRFRNVFDFAYRRYIDVATAEAQAKEARIETALERVRAVAMAMKKSDDLLGICEVLYKELGSLGFSGIRNGLIDTFEAGKDYFADYDYSDATGGSITYVPYKSHPIVESFIKKLTRTPDSFSELVVDESELNGWKEYRKRNGQPEDPSLNNCSSLYYYMYSIGISSIGISAFKPLAKDKVAVLERFANVFKLAYQRYTDITLAEAQAREAQIELALERVRARTMAMQHSDELSETAYILYQQFKELGQDPEQLTIGIVDETKRIVELWLTMHGKHMSHMIPVSIDEPFVISKVYAAFKAQKKSLVVELSGKDLKDYNDYRNSLRPDVKVNNERTEERRIMNFAFFSKGQLSLSAPEPLSDEGKQLLERFAAVFDLTYTRFCDLQKAEAQAREAKIEAALEKVRSRSLAMHKSEELKDVVATVFEKMNELFFLTDGGVSIVTGFKAFEYADHWVAADKIGEPVLVRFPHTQNPIPSDFTQAKIDGTSFYSKKYTQEVIENNWRLNFQHGLYKDYPDEFKNWFLSREVMHFTVAFEKNSAITVASYIDQPITEDQKIILQRFARIFEQCYIRFLDLQKAEAQAKEAQIETALERVRARTMGMQKSEELKEVIQVVYDQFVQLNINTEHTGFVIDYKLRDDRLIWVASKHGVPSQLTIPYFDCEYYNSFNEAKEKGWDFFATNLSFEDKNNFYRELFKYIPELPEDAKEFYFSCPGLAISTVLLDNVGLYIENFLGTPFTVEENATLMRFGKVFQQTYTRFIDLQKAEAQSRESQIQLALERGRTQSMIMQHSNELDDTLRVFHEQVLLLGINSAFSFLWLPDEEKSNHIFWAAWAEEKNNTNVFKSKAITYPLDRNEPATAQCLIDWKSNEPVVSYAVLPQGVKNYFAAWQELIDGVEKLTPQHFTNGLYYVEAFMKYGCFGVILENDLTTDEKKILDRFATEFERAYTRFLDLQKAEEQTKESQVQLAMERVRARTMAMQHSDELPDAANILFQQVQSLGMAAWSAGYCIWDNDKKAITLWMSSAGIIQKPFRASTTEDPSFIHFYEAWKRGETFYEEAIGGNELVSHYKYMCNLPVVGEMLNKFVDEGGLLPTFQIYHLAFFSQGFLLFITYEPVPEAHDIFKRFGNVFDQTYTRFLDLQKAEAQAREATIEMSLERVRAKTMAMHNSKDLKEVITLLSEQFLILGFNIHSANFNTSYRQKDWDLWLYTPGSPMVQDQIHIPYFDHPYFNRTIESIASGADFTAFVFTKEEKDRFLDHIYANTLAKHASEERKKYTYAGKGFAWSSLYLKNTAITIANYDAVPYSEDQNAILRRFGNVFEQTYTRFLDLQKAEAQTREAQIEMALEKVRSRAMAMQKPGELIEVAELLRKEMGLLGVEELETSSIYIHHQDTQNTECWYAIKDVKHAEKELVSDYMDINLNDTAVGKQMLSFYESGEKKISIPMQGVDRKEWINYCASRSKVLVDYYGDNIPDRTYHLYKFSNGYMGAASPADISAESWDLLKRATTVFSLAYTRFSDLQQAEAQAREAAIEVALERVRSRTLAMQKSDELAETAVVLFKQLIGLGIEPNRLYIGIVKEETGDMEMWATDEDGSEVSTKFMFNKKENVSVKKLYDGWAEKKKSVIVDMEGKELEDYLHYLKNVMHIPFKGGLSQKRRVQHVAYFSKGFIGMASPDEQSHDSILLLERFAAVFNLTFTRFNDLKVAEAHAEQAVLDLIKLQTEKKRAEDALTELRATQTQLIQSEKMASLGELTAGIAHEIQNPLNFVNNFSEVSNELIDEMNAEIEKGDLEEAKAIANDIKQNLEKINHHGKRADAIVKGMLQHSRSSSATKEPTDINKLADEYLRLAYHGLRAKDKSFNATLKTDYDATLEKVNVIPQDIGRVVLNLITNAFYAVSEKLNAESLKPEHGKFEPLVSIETKKINNNIEIKVSDNGNGIPKNIVDKIFQPFFTTKPTGQGTGLGLSLAYDIVKAHGGELKVETKVEEGTTFIITLSLS